MRVDFIGHASLLVRSGPLALLTDPWWRGPAYQRQWFAWPFPVPERYDLDRLDAIFISHGHEDHMHAPTLQTLPKDARVLMARSYDAGNVAYLHRLGFKRVEEIASGASFTLARAGHRMKITVFTYLGDSIAAVEADGQVLLDVNDALHCARDVVIDEYCRVIARRFPRIDYLFCGFGGASYFPNCFRREGKNDVAVARRREELFLRKFARVAERLRPRLAFPFAAHFVLPDERNWWISELRLRAPDPAKAIARLCREPVDVIDLQPGDFVEDGRVHATPRRELDPESVRRAVLERHPAPPSAPVDAARFAELASRVERVALRNLERVRAPVDALIRLWDYPLEALRVRVIDGRPRVERMARAQAELAEPQLVLETRSDLLELAVDDEYGRDQLCIGYGALVHLRTPEAAHANLHDHLLSLITPFPTWLDRLKRHPLRCAQYLLRDPGARLAARRKLTQLTTLGKSSGVYTAEDWL